MWLAHFLFHLLSGAGTAVPVVQRVAGDLGVSLLGAPDWSAAARWGAGGLVPLELLCLDAGLLMALYTAWRIAGDYADRTRRALGLWIPWASLALMLYIAGAWIVLQPMQMRGMMH